MTNRQETTIKYWGTDKGEGKGTKSVWREAGQRVVRGWRGGLGDEGEEGQRKEGVESGLENKGQVGQ